MPAAKRALDLAISVTALCVLSPLLILVAIAVVLESGFPVLYSQTRVGREFRKFRIWKFRSMRANAGGPSITADGDPRVTRIGRFLRASKLDELPQLWNVVRGEMSLVGPRPEIPEYVSLFKERYRSILKIRPGITDPASLRFRNESAELASAADPRAEYVNTVLPAKLDLADQYVLQWSLALDMRILFRTVLSLAEYKVKTS